ncbi:MAG: hypothetical protein U9R08_04015 [Nanoarchaeota archaeon]|nr:hypothetical protein [Nanoarchaeota archaeon]
MKEFFKITKGKLIFVGIIWVGVLLFNIGIGFCPFFHKCTVGEMITSFIYMMVGHGLVSYLVACIVGWIIRKLKPTTLN